MALETRQQQAIAYKQAKEEQRLAKLYERQEAVIEGRRNGETFRSIAKRTGRAVSDVHKDYVQAMDRLAPIESIEDFRRLTLERLEDMFADARTMMECAETDKEWSRGLSSALAIVDRQVKVTGLDKHTPEAQTTVDLRVHFEDISAGLKTLAKHNLIEVEEYQPPAELEAESDE